MSNQPPIPFADPAAVDALLRDAPSLAGLSIHASLAEAMYRFRRAEEFRLKHPADFANPAAPAVACHPDGTVMLNRAAARQLSDLYAGDGDDMIVDRAYARAQMLAHGVPADIADAMLEAFKRPRAEPVDFAAARTARQHKPDGDAA